MKRMIAITMLMLSLLPAGIFAQAQNAPAKMRANISHRLLVKLRGSANQTAAQAMLQRTAPSLATVKIKAVHSTGIFLVEGQPDIDFTAVQTMLQNDPAVEFVEPDYVFYAADRLPNDPEFAKQWGLHNVGQTVNGVIGKTDADIDGPTAWDHTTGSPEVVIAVIDAGMAWDHPDLQANTWQNQNETADRSDSDKNGYVDDVRGWDFVDGDNDPYDYNGHGTHVAGIAAASSDNGIGIAGVSWNARLMPLRVLNVTGEGLTSNIVSAIDYAVKNGAKIINASFGSYNASASLRLAIEAANQAGVLVCTAAGNNSDNNDYYPLYPASYDLDNIIAVAATEQNDGLASFSNYGTTAVDVAAPGANIYSTLPVAPTELFFDNMESGSGNWSADLPWSLTTSQAFSPTHSWTDSPSENYRSFVNASLYLKRVLRLKGYQGAKLSFKLQSFVYQSAALLIEASSDQKKWNTLSQVTGFLTQSGQWLDWDVDMGAFNGADSVYVRFRLTNNGGSTADGVYIDDVRLTAYPAGPYTYRGDEYGFKSGTSMATPFVSGVAALIWSKTPGYTYQEIRRTILETVDKLAALNNRVATGGRINAAAATLNAQSLAVELVPDPFDFTLDLGDSATAALVLKNTGERWLDFRVTATTDSTAGQSGPQKFAPRSAAENQATQGELAGVRILWERYHGQATSSNWSTVIADLARRGATVTENYNFISVDSLKSYTILWTTDGYSWSANEISAVQNWLKAGGALLVEGDDSENVFNAILPPNSGINFSFTSGASGSTGKIYPHATTIGVKNIFIPSAGASLEVSGPAQHLIDDVNGLPNTAFTRYGAGRIIAMADENFINSAIGQADNLLFANQAIAWLAGRNATNWLFLAQTSGSLAPGDSTSLAVRLSAASLRPDSTYRQTLQIFTNALEDKPAIVPVRLQVKPVDYYFSLTSLNKDSSGQAGDTLAYAFTIKNLGRQSDSYNLDVASTWPATIWNAAGTSPLTRLGPVAPQAEAKFLAKVTIPNTTAFGQNNTTTLQAVAVGRPTLSRSHAAVTTSLGPILSLPFSDNFSTMTLNLQRWTITHGTPSISTDGQNEPSAPNSLRLKGGAPGDEVESKTIDLSKESGVVLSYFHEHSYVYFGEDLVISYYDGNNWIELSRHQGDGNYASNFSRYEIVLPAAAYHARFKLRFTNSAVDEYRYWFVDNVALVRPPRLVVNPESFLVKLPPDTSASLTMTLSNAGESNLNFQLFGAPRRVSTSFAMIPPSVTNIDPDAANAHVEPPSWRRALKPATRTRTATLADLTGLKILWDRSHGQASMAGWSTIVNDLCQRGATVTENTAPITASLLSRYNVLWVIDFDYDWYSQSSVVSTWLANGGALLLETDESYYYYLQYLLPSTAGIFYAGSGESGFTANLYSHITTVGLNQIALFNPISALRVDPPAVRLIDDTRGVTNTAYSLVGKGKVLVMADENFSNQSIGLADNQLFANQVFDWFAGAQVNWLTFTPASGQIAPGNNQRIDLDFNTAGLVQDSTYQATVWVFSNDPQRRSFPISAGLEATGQRREPVHFTFSANTGGSYGILIDRATLDAQRLGSNDEIGVFTPAGKCVGAAVVNGNWPLGLTAWQDDSQTPEVDGYQPGETMYFRIWNTGAVTTPDYSATAEYTTGNGTFGFGVFSQIAHLESFSTELRTLALRPGWNWISLNVEPAILDIEQVLAPLQTLQIAEDCAGKTYRPDGTDTIGKFDFRRGYKLRLAAAETLRVHGKSVAANTPVILPKGWGCVSYLPTWPLACETALASLGANLSVIKDDSGRFYIPGKINMLGKMQAGRGYEINLLAADTLIYPLGASIYEPYLVTSIFKTLPLAHFRLARTRGESFSLVVNSVAVDGLALKAGDEIGVLTPAGLLVGAGVWNGAGPLPITAWQDDASTQAIDGYRRGEKMVFKLWQAGEERELALNADYEVGSGTFGETPFAVLALQGEALPKEFSLAQNYPNPFWSEATSRLAGNPETKIKFALPQNSRVKITIYNIVGQAVRTLIDEVLASGHHEARWDGANDLGAQVASGVYIYRMEAGSFHAQRRLLYLR